MIDFKGKVLPSLVSATISGVVVFGGGWAYSTVRTNILEQNLEKALIAAGAGYGYDPTTNSVTDVTLQLQNTSTSPVRVRMVLLAGAKSDNPSRFIEFKPKEGGLAQTPLLGGLLHGTLNAESLGRSFAIASDFPETQYLPPMTTGWWMADPQTVADVGSKHWVMSRVLAVFEYPTMFGGTALVPIEFSPPNSEIICNSFNEASKAAFEKMVPTKMQQAFPNSSNP